jgi:hypothetical protein
VSGRRDRDLDHGGDERGRHPVTGDVSHQEAGAEWVDGNELVEVTGHRGQGLLRGRDADAAALRLCGT